MTKQVFKDSKFFSGMKGKVSGVWYVLKCADFCRGLIIIDDGKGYDLEGSVISYEHIEELEALKE